VFGVNIFVGIVVLVNAAKTAAGKMSKLPMKINSVKLLASAALLGAALLPMAAHADSINQRLHDQHQRIHQGVTSKQLTRSEQYRLNRRDARIHSQEQLDRRFDHGHLTPSERRNLQSDLNRSSSRVYQDKHNNRVR
jgi:hypothetical protein